MTKISFSVTYDTKADVLYISTTREAALRGVEDDSGILWRYGRDGKLIGATVMDYYDRWADHKSELTEELSKRFSVPITQMEIIISHVSRQ